MTPFADLTGTPAERTRTVLDHVRRRRSVAIGLSVNLMVHCLIEGLDGVSDSDNPSVWVGGHYSDRYGRATTMIELTRVHRVASSVDACLAAMPLLLRGDWTGFTMSLPTRTERPPSVDRTFAQVQPAHYSGDQDRLIIQHSKGGTPALALLAGILMARAHEQENFLFGWTDHRPGAPVCLSTGRRL